MILIQAGIHTDEIDGKDGGLMLLRDLGLRNKGSFIDVADLVLVPIRNVDGNERPSPFDSAYVCGPDNHGIHPTAQSINLNLDYAKADAPETRSVLRHTRRLDPLLYIDVQVPDGFDHGCDITYNYTAWGRYMHTRSIATG